MQPHEPAKTPEQNQKNLVPFFVIGGVTIILIIATILISVKQKDSAPSTTMSVAPTSEPMQTYQNPFTATTVMSASPTEAYQNPFAPTATQASATSDQPYQNPFAGSQ